MTTKRIKGTQEDFEKALDEINPDPTTHYNKKSPKDNFEEVKELTETEKAIQTLITGCEMACEKGAFDLQDARTIMNAIDFLNNSD